MLDKKTNELINIDGKLGFVTKSGSVVLKEDFLVSDVRTLQKFLRNLLEIRSRLPSE
tara:strand:+ start:192 stop:362 length:171 start_codon:yes stop_codon:yes gene_type:complete